MNLITEVLAWLGNPARWSGSGGVPARVTQHLGYTALTLAIATAIAVPVGAVIGHTGRGGFLVVGLANGLRALPTLDDPRGNFAAQNVVPLINSAKLTPTISETLNAVSARLDTQTLTELNARLAAPDKPDPDQVAKEWLSSVGLT